MKKFSRFLFLGLLLVSTGCGRKEKPGDIAAPISGAEIQQAIDYGIENYELSVTEFTSDWTVDLGYREGNGNATIITPFLKAALLSRQAAVAHRKLDPGMIERALKEEAGYLNFEITLFGGYPQFGRSVKFILEYMGEEIQPDYMFMPPFSQIARDYTQIASGKARFRKDVIPEDAKITLVSTFKADPDIEEFFTARFEFDLGKYR